MGGQFGEPWSDSLQESTVKFHRRINTLKTQGRAKQRGHSHMGGSKFQTRTLPNGVLRWREAYNLTFGRVEREANSGGGFLEGTDLADEPLHRVPQPHIVEIP